MSALLVIITMHFKVLKLKNDKAKALWTYRLFYKTFWNVELILSDKNANLANPSCNLIIFKTMELCVQCPCFSWRHLQKNRLLLTTSSSRKFATVEEI